MASDKIKKQENQEIKRGRKTMNQKSKLTFGKIFERFAYGCGDFGCNIIYTAMSAFLLFYYTDYAGVSAMAVGNDYDDLKDF